MNLASLRPARPPWHFLLVIIVASLCTIALCRAFYIRESRQIETIVSERESLRTAALVRQFGEDLREGSNLIGMLTDSDTLRKYLEDGSEENREALAREFLNASRHQGDFDKIRYLDETGMEKARINFTTGVVPPGQLQNKADRPFFQSALKLAHGSICLSAFDLNVENGAVEMPFKPALRFSMRAYDAQGKPRGVVVINYFAQHLLDHFLRSNPALSKRMRLLNAEGYWLRGAKPEEEWGFMLPERAQYTLAKTAPGLWHDVETREEGQVPFDGGLFTWRHFKPSAYVPGGGQGTAVEDRFLVVASQISEAEWNASFLKLRQSFMVIGFALFGVTIAGVLLYANQLVERERRRETDELNAAILRSAGAGVITSDPEGMVRSINAKAEQLLGWKADEVIGRQNIAIFFERNDPRPVTEPPVPTNPNHPDGDSTAASNFPGAAQETVEHERICVRKDGTRFPAWIANSGICDRTGRVICNLGVFADITERMESERLIRDARAVAEESTRLKARFLANMSHEIRTPMNGVFGMISLLLDTDLSAEQRSLANTVRSSADSLLTVINDILDFSKIEAGQLVFNAAPFDLRDPVESALGLLAEKAHAKGLEIAYLIDENVPTQLVGDAGRLQQILLNLTGNAVKFTEQGEVVLDVRRVSENNRQVRLRFSVRDTGIGISPEVQARLFQAFVQADSSTSTKFGGTGLGLAISRQLVMLMSGEIGVESQPGHGSTFWFTAEFPMQDAAPKTVARRIDLAGYRSLIVDDNATNREVLSRQLSAWHVKTLAVSAADEAMATLRSEIAANRPVDFALLDLQLPGMNGVQLARTIRGFPEYGSIKLVFIGSTGQTLSKRQLDEFGGAACLSKPVRQSQLQEAMERALGNSPITAPSKVAENRPPAPLPPADLKLRILLAEDNLVNQQVARLQLEKFGYRPDVVGDGQKAIEAVHSSAYDIIFMDCQMPVMDGFEATRRIRLWEIQRRERGEEVVPIFIIAMTANAMVGDREACLQAGMDYYVSKPVRSAELATAIAHAPAAQQQ